MDAVLVKTASESATFICCDGNAMSGEKAAALQQAGVHLIALGDQGTIAPALRIGLESYGWSNVLVEAGGGLVGRLAEERLLNEVLVMIAPTLLGDPSGIAPFRGDEKDRISDGIALDPITMLARDSEFIGWYRMPEDVRA